MFDNITKYSVWDLMTESVKYKDLSTAQLLYEGSQRGQTERYMVTVGDMIVTMFQKIEEMYSWGDPQNTDLDLLFYLQRQYAARYIEADTGTENLVKEFLAEIIPAWRLKGTKAFLHWIIWKVFGWQLEQIIALTVAFKVNSTSSFLYDPTKSAEQHKVLYEGSMGSGTSQTLVINIFSDPDFADKQAVLEGLISEWGTEFLFQYV